MIKNKYTAAVTDKPWWLAGGIDPSWCMAAYRPVGASDYAASKINLAKPGTYNAADGGAYPTWGVGTGWTFNGSTQYLTTNLIPELNQKWSAIVRQYVNIAANDCALFSRSGTSLDFGMYQGTGTVFYPHNSKSIACTVTNTHNRNSVLAVAGRNGYADGVLLAGEIDVSTGTATKDIYIGAGNNNGSASYFLNCNIYAVAIYNNTLTAYQIAELTKAMNAL